MEAWACRLPMIGQHSPRMRASTLLLFLFAPPLPAQAAQPAPVRDLAGRVAGSKEQIAGARVTVWRNDMDRASVEPLCDGKTDGEGRFAFKAVPWLQGHVWGSNTMIVVARTGHEAVGLLEVRGDGVDLNALAVELLAAVEVTGIVRDNDDRPVAGAAVWPWMFAAPDGKKSVWITAPMVPWLGRTGTDGRFVLKGLPAGMRLTMFVQHPGHAEQRVEADSSRPCEVTLAPGATIRGVVRMPDGKPAVRVMVAAQGQKQSHFGRVQTDEAGRYAMQSLPEDTYNLWAEAEGLTVIALDSVAARPGEPQEGQDLQLVRGGFIVGRVVDAATGKPVQPGPTADVAMYGPARPHSGGGCEVAPVGADGSFRIRAPEGVNYVYLRPGAGWVEGTSGQNVTVVEGQEVQVEFRAKPGKRPDGR
jgi:Carboxypeptidase regulatory-like domain